MARNALSCDNTMRRVSGVRPGAAKGIELMLGKRGDGPEVQVPQSRISGQAITVGVRLVGLAGSLLMTLVVASRLGAAASGEFFAALVMTTLVATIARYGTDNLALRDMSHQYHFGHLQLRRTYVSLLLWCCVSSVAVSIIYWVASPLLEQASHSGDEMLKTLRLMTLSVLPFAVSLFNAAALRSVGRVISGTLAELGSTQFITIALVMAAGKHPEDASLAAVAWLAATWLTALWSLALLAGLWWSDRTAQVAGIRNHPSAAEFSAMTGMMATSVLFYALTYAPVMVLWIFAPSADVARFMLAVQVAGLLALIPAVQAGALGPQFAHMWAKRNLPGINTLARNSTRLALLAALPLAAVALLATPWLLALLGPEFVPAAAAARFLVLGQSLTMAFGVTSTLMLLTGLEHQAVRLAAIMLTLSVPLLVVGVRNFAADAATAAAISALASVLYAAGASYSLWKKRRLQSSDLVLAFRLA